MEKSINMDKTQIVTMSPLVLAYLGDTVYESYIREYLIRDNCHKKVKENKLEVTDDTMVAELFGNDVYLYEGEYTSIKITTPEDWILAQYLVES